MGDLKQDQKPAEARSALLTAEKQPYQPLTEYKIAPRKKQTPAAESAEQPHAPAETQTHPLAQAQVPHPQTAAQPAPQQPAPEKSPLEKANDEFKKAQAEYLTRVKASQHNLDSGKVAISGLEKQIEIDKKDAKLPWWRVAVDLVVIPLAAYDIADMGTRKQIKKGIEAETKLLAADRKQLEAAEQSHKSALELGQKISALEPQLQKLIAEGRTAEVQQLLENATKALKQANPMIGTQKVGGKNADYTQAMQEIGQALEDHVRHIGYAETTVRVVRNTAIATGVVVGTAGVGTGVMAVGGGITATGWGTAITFTTLGSTAAAGAGNLTEAVGHVSWGNKDAGQAFKDAGTQTLIDGKNNAINSVATAAAFATGAPITGVIQRGLTVAATRSVISSVAHGTIDTAIAEKFEWSEIEEKISSKVSRDDLEEIHQQWKKSRGLTVQQLVRNGVIDLGVSAVLGGTGAQTSALTQSMSTGGRIATVTAVDSTVGTIVGTASGKLKASLDGREFTANDFIAEATGSIASSVAGSASQAFQSRGPDSASQNQPNAPADGSKPAKTGAAAILNATPFEALKIMRERAAEAHDRQVYVDSEAAARPGREAAAPGTQFEMNLGQISPPPANKVSLPAAKPVENVDTGSKTLDEGRAAGGDGLRLPTDQFHFERQRSEVSERNRTAAVDQNGERYFRFMAPQGAPTVEIKPAPTPAPAEAKSTLRTAAEIAMERHKPLTEAPAESAPQKSPAQPNPTPAVSTSGSLVGWKDKITDGVSRFLDNTKLRVQNTFTFKGELEPMRGPNGTELPPETFFGWVKDTFNRLQFTNALRYTLDAKEKGIVTQRVGLPVGVDPAMVNWSGNRIHDRAGIIADSVRNSVPILGPIAAVPVRWIGDTITGWVSRDLKVIPPAAFPGGKIPERDWLRDGENWDRTAIFAPGYDPKYFPKNNPNLKNVPASSIILPPRKPS